jgi:hypothetical protein
MVGQELWEADRGRRVTKKAATLPVLRPDLKVVWFRRTMPLYKPGITFDLRTLDEHVNYVLTRYLRNDKRKTEVNHFDAEFGYVGFELRPVMSRGRINLTRYGVLLVPANQSTTVLDEFKNFQPDLTLHDRHRVHCGVVDGNKKGLYHAFSRAVRYPRWMLEGDPLWCTAMVRLLKRFRSTANYGKVDGVVHYKKGSMPHEDQNEDHDNE